MSEESLLKPARYGYRALVWLVLYMAWRVGFPLAVIYLAPQPESVAAAIFVVSGIFLGSTVIGFLGLYNLFWWIVVRNKGDLSRRFVVAVTALGSLLFHCLALAFLLF